MSSKIQFDPDYVTYVTEVAKALNDLRYRRVSYGEYHIREVTFGFDGEATSDLAVVQGEHDALVVEVTIT